MSASCQWLPGALSLKINTVAPKALNGVVLMLPQASSQTSLPFALCTRFLSIPEGNVTCCSHPGAFGPAILPTCKAAPLLSTLTAPTHADVGPMAICCPTFHLNQVPVYFH